MSRLHTSVALLATLTMTSLSPIWANAAPLKDPPSAVIGIGGEKCRNYAKTYEDKQKIDKPNHGQPMEKVLATWASMADFTGFLGGYTARVQMEQGLDKPPFRSRQDALDTMYKACSKIDPDGRFVDVLDHVLQGGLSVSR